MAQFAPEYSNGASNEFVVKLEVILSDTASCPEPFIHFLIVDDPLVPK
jgi:hypothetical protein